MTMRVRGYPKAVLLFFLLFAGCISPPPNEPPEVTLDSAELEGIISFQPGFTYGCSDPENELLLCELKSDGKAVFAATSFPKRSFRPIVFNESGTHTLEMIAVDQEGIRVSKTLTFTALEPPNEPPQVLLESDALEGRMPFYPQFSYNCWDPEGQLELCELRVDNEVVASAAYAPDLNSSIVFRQPGPHTVEIVARDQQGAVSRTNLTFIASNILTLYVADFPHDVDASYVSTIREAEAYWEREDDLIFREVQPPQQYDVYVDWIKEYGGLHVGTAEFEGSRLNIGLGDSGCYGKWRPYTYETVANIATHELGHILGYDHVNDTTDIMHPIANRGEGTQYAIDVQEDVVAPEGWIFYYPVCTSRQRTTYSFEVTSDKYIEVYVIPDQEEYEKALAGEEFSSYPGCRSKGTYHFNEVCTVDRTALLMVAHTLDSDTGAARISIEIVEQ